MANVYVIKPLKKKSIQWVVEMFRQNHNDTVSWFTLRELYRWGQGFVHEDLDCNLPFKGDDIAYATTDCGWGAEFDDSIGIEWEFSEDIPELEQQEIKESYYQGGAGWLFDGEHDWTVEDDQVVVYAPFQVSLCDETTGEVHKANVKLKKRPAIDI